MCARPKTPRLWTDLQGHGGVVRLSFLLLLLLPSPRSAPARGQAGAGTRQLAAAGELGVGGRVVVLLSKRGAGLSSISVCVIEMGGGAN